ncbi:MAG TPA: hypothetical protein VGM47_08505, partial [Gammaproteobacteria bacterium]
MSRLTDATVNQSYTYNSPSGPATNSQTHESTFTYNSQFSVNTEVANVGSATPLTTTYTYDPVFGNKIKATQTGSGISSGGYVTQSSYDANGLYALTATNALGQVTQYQYDPRFGSQTQVTDPNGVSVSTTYDPLGRKASQTGPRSTQSVTWAYANCTACRDPMAVYYTTETRSDGQVVTTQYDAAGRAVMTRSLGLNGRQIDVFTMYDPLGRAYMTSAPAWDGLGVPLCWTYDVYDILGRTTEVDAPAQGSTCNGPSITTAAEQYYPSAPSGQGYSVTTSSYSGLK